MGVPKFFRWLSERYPKINQRFGSPAEIDTSQRYFDQPPPPPLEPPDPLSTCGLPPPVDRLYLDMNGIIHGCSHNNESQKEGDEDEDGEGFDTVSKISNEDIFRNICYYLDRVVGDMVQPNQLVYMAIDGVAPRAKLNQQRSRRYRSGTEGDIETNIYDAHAKAVEEENRKRRLEREEEEEEPSAFSIEDGYSFVFNGKEESDKSNNNSNINNKANEVQEVTPGRFKGKFETSARAGNADDTEAFHSNVITPGTPFFSEFTKHLEHFVKYKISTDPKWQNLTIVFSGPNVPGEGEHKIMQFIREQKAREDYNPNLRHCIMGQDGDLMMLGLATHEPNLVLLRERVVFNMAKQRMNMAAAGNSLDAYIHNPHFEFLHMGVLRDYLAFEFETSNVLGESPWDLEHTIDDFVFMTFFVGNDFLPHMPALDIGDNAFDLLFWTYKQCRKEWLVRDPERPYLTDAGTIISGRRLEEFLSAVGSHEVDYYDKKKQSSHKENDRLRKEYKKWGMGANVPDEHLVASKEESDRVRYRKMLQKQASPTDAATTSEFSPVMTGDFEPAAEEDLEEGLVSRMGNLLQNSLSQDHNNNRGDDATKLISVDDQDLKGRYYHDKFHFTPFDAEKHLALRKAYIEGLVWNLKYYYEGCVSWEWYFPFHYGPMLSDLVNLDELLEQVNFEDNVGTPLKPFEQLMGCMPPSQSHHLPEPYRCLMTDPDSPIIDFYPKTFTIDMNGKRWPWEAVALLPFIDSKRLLDASGTVDESLLTEEERKRNSTGKTVVMKYDSEHSESIAGIGDTEGFHAIEDNKAISIPFEVSGWNHTSEKTPILEPKLTPGVEVPLSGYGTLRVAPVHSLWRRKLGINVFGSRSRYKTSCLEISSFMPPLPPIESLAPKLIGTSVFVNYPHFVEGLVTAVSDEQTTIRGRKEARKWTPQESQRWRVQRDGVARRLETGEGYTGTGGLIIPEDQAVTLSVRPFDKLVKTKDGTLAKSYAKFEVEVPLISTFWNPSQPDLRLLGVPSRLEKNAYEIASPLNEVNPSNLARSAQFGSKRGKLFPAKTPGRDLGASGDKSKKSVAYYSSSHSGERSNPGRNNLSGARTRLSAPRNGDIGKRRLSTRARPDEWEIGSDATSIIASWTQRFKFAETGANQQLPNRAPANPVQNTPGPSRLYHSATRLGLNRPTTAASKISGPRGRLLSAGVVAAAFLFNPTGASETGPSSWGLKPTRDGRNPSISSSRVPLIPPTTLAASQTDLLGIRGGDYEEGHQKASTVPPLEFAHGTTTISFIFQGGIIAAVDSRASLGSFVGSKTTQKVLPVNSHILGTMAGGAADCMFWIRKLKSEAMLHELTEGCRMSVARASRLLSNALYQNRGLDLSVGTMIMGFGEDGPPRIYYVDNSGVRIEGDMFAVGSGGTFALGILDTERRHNMTEDEAIALGIKAIRHATFRDAYSGGFINVFLITKEGWEKVFTEDLARSRENFLEATNTT